MSGSSRNPITSNYLGVRRKGDKGDSAYEIAVRNGFSGTESQWLLTLKGDPGLGSQGNTGKSNYDIAVANGFVGTEEQWLASIKGKNGYTPIKGIDYVDGKEVEFQTTATHIQWRYVGNPDWQNLIILSALKGDPGDRGLKGDTGDDGFTPIKGLDYFDGKNIELQKNTTHIQWKYTDDLEWNNLILISDLKGDQGDKGDDSIIPGPKGDDGYTPIKGVDYNDGIDGVGISSIILQSTVGLNKTYRITLTNSSTYDFTVIDGEDGVNGSDASVTKVNVEAVLTGDITSHSHSDAIVYSIIL